MQRIKKGDLVRIISGEETSKEAPIKLSKLAIVSAKAPQGISKIAYRIDKNNKKVRIAKKTNTEVVVGKKK